MILIVCAAGDDHVAAVEPELTRRGVSVLRFDLADLPARAELSVAFEKNAPARVGLRVRDSEFNLRAVTAVWSRRPQVPSPDPDIAHRMIRHYVSQETADVWIGASALLECPWLPAPRWQELRASYKPLQLQVAADLGFQIPSTLMTNSPRDFLDFHRRHNGAIVSKTVHNRLLPVDAVDSYDAYVLTESVANRNVADVDAVRYCPVTVQPNVEKRVELRITVVGDRIFPVQIESQWTHHTRHDWRRGDPHHTRFAVHDLPRDVERRAVQLVKQLGLRFGALDLILTPDGRYVFLEINPNGSWLAMERTTGLPIAAAIADLLAGHEVTSVPARPARAVSQTAADASTQPPAPAVPSSIRSTPRARAPDSGGRRGRAEASGRCGARANASRSGDDRTPSPCQAASRDRHGSGVGRGALSRRRSL